MKKRGDSSMFAHGSHPPKIQPSVGKDPPPLFPETKLPPTPTPSSSDLFLLRRYANLKKHFQESPYNLPPIVETKGIQRYSDKYRPKDKREQLLEWININAEIIPDELRRRDNKVVLRFLEDNNNAKESDKVVSSKKRTSEPKTKKGEKKKKTKKEKEEPESKFSEFVEDKLASLEKAELKFDSKPEAEVQETQEEEGPSLEDLEDEILGNEEDLRMEFDDEEDEYNEPDRDYDNEMVY